MAIKLTDLTELTTPTGNTIVLAVDSSINPDASYKLGLNTIRDYSSVFVFSRANSAFIAANSSYIWANSAYDKANSVNSYGNTIFGYTNSAFIVANSSFVKCNSAYDKANSTWDYSNSSFYVANSSNILANSAYNKANISFTLAQSSFDKANQVYNLNSIAYDYANSAFAVANSCNAVINVSNLNSTLALSYSAQSYSTSNSASIRANLAFSLSNTVYDLITPVSLTASLAYAAANTVSSNLQDYKSKNVALNAKIYGAFGDGVSEDTSAIQNLIYSANGTPIFLPSGNYVLGQIELIPGVSIYGCGGFTKIFPSSNNINIFNYSSTSNNNQTRFNISEITFDVKNKTNCNAICIVGNTSVNSICSDINIKNIKITQTNTSAKFGFGVRLENCTKSIIEYCDFLFCNTDVLLANTTKVRIYNNILCSNTSTNNIIETSNSNTNIIYGNILYNSATIIGSKTIYDKNSENVKY